jgi:hypothetical protein
MLLVSIMQPVKLVAPQYIRNCASGANSTPLGGVTPLETLQGLPSYEEAEMQRSRSESDLASIVHLHPHPIAPLLPLRSDEAGPGPERPEPSVATH